MKKEILIFNSIDKYIHWLILKFTLIAKRARFTLERLAKMIIGNGMISQEKDLLTEMLYNLKAVLVWDFTEMEKVKKKVAPAQKF